MGYGEGLCRGVHPMRFTQVKFSRTAAIEHGLPDTPAPWLVVPWVLMEDDLHTGDDILARIEGRPLSCQWDDDEAPD